MQAILATIKVGDAGPQVADLQDALSLLLKRGEASSRDYPERPSPDERAELARRLADERAQSTYGEATQRLVQIVQRQQGLGDSLLGAVDGATADVLNRLLKELGAFDDAVAREFVVKGTVTLAAGAPAVGHIVRARDRDLRTFESLGKATVTGPDGGYEIRYSPGEFSRAEAGSADLVVRIFSADRAGDRDEPLVESSTMFNAPAVAEINLQVPNTDVSQSEFERHVAAVVPLLVGQGEDGDDLAIAELVDTDLDFVAGDTGIERQHLAWLRTAYTYSPRTPAERVATHLPAADGQVFAALFYGWFREGVSDEWSHLTEQSTGTLRTAASAAIAHGIIPAELESRLESSLDAMPNPKRDSLRAAVTLVGVHEEAVATVLQHAGSVAEVNNAAVSRLVDAGEMASGDAHRLGLAVAAHALVEGDQATMAALLGVKPARLDGKGLQRARDLAALDTPDIEKALGDANVEPPAGVTLPSYAARLAGQIADLLPTDALLLRATNVSDEVVSSVERVVASDHGGSPKDAGLHAGSEPLLQALINLHPGLGLGKVVDEATDAAAAVSTIKERVAWVDRVNELNPDLDLFAIDYLPESESLKQVSFEGLSDEARSMVVGDLKAYQRVQILGAGALDSIALLKTGYRSSTALARSTPLAIAEQTGLPVEQTRVYYQQAEQKANEAALAWIAFHDLARDTRTLKQRAFVEPPEYLKQLEGYDELFGSADFCDCEACRSVLGPAAYFVDLMYWVERHILDPSFKAHGGENNDLHLRSRRPDLWTLELTCENTNNVVASLDLVIDMLEKFVVKEKGLGSSEKIYERLASVDYSIRLPFSLPVERLSIFLGHLGISRAEIARAFLLRTDDAAMRTRVRLGMVKKQFEIITTSRLGDLGPAAIREAEAFFSGWLGGANLTFSVIPGETETRTLSPAGVLVFVEAAGLELGVVSAVLATEFVNGAAPGAPEHIQLEAGIAAPGGVQNDSEWVMNLTSGRLDRFERFIRLWRHIPWTLAELDYVLGRLQRLDAPAHHQLDERVLVALGELLDIQDRLQVPVDELCAVWDGVPSIVLQGETSLLDRAFNLPVFVRQDRAWPVEDRLFDQSASERARLVAAMQISDADLTLLISGLKDCLSGNKVDAEGREVFWLGERNLSLLYRYARLARLLNLSVDDLLQTVALTASIAAKSPDKRCILTLEDLRAALDVHAWRMASGFSLPEIRFITDGTSSLAGYDAPDVLAVQIATEVIAEKSLHIALGVFTQIGLTQAESVKAIVDNTQPVGGKPPLLEQVPGDESYRVTREIAIADVATTLRFDPEPQATLISAIARDLYRIVRRGGADGFDASALIELGLSKDQAVALIAANLSAAANDHKPFEKVPGSITNFELRAGISEAAAITRFGTDPQDVLATKSILRHRAVELVLRHHAETVLATKASIAVKLSPEKTIALLNLATPSTPALQNSLVDAAQGGPLTSLSAVLDKVTRYAVLFRSGNYDSQALDLVRMQPAVLAFADPPTAETVRRVSTYAALATAPDPAYEPDAPTPDVSDLQSVLTWTDSIATATADDTKLTQIAEALRSEVPQVKGVLSQIGLADGPALARSDELSQLAGALALTRRLGVAAEVLKLTVSDDSTELARAADGIFAAIRAKYPDEAAFTEKLEPFEDKLRSRTRDGLVEYLLSAPDEPPNHPTTDWRTRFARDENLYHHFLTDVMVGGCARTSRVVAAISTLQLYVQRVLMNLEQSSEIPPQVVARLDDPERQKEWLWRKNFQVWVANRKVFLYPENYIEPGLRDDKTPLFTDLEDTLLQQQISEQNTLDAYSQYLHGFDELSHLRIAGAYHDRHDASGDLLHLFGVTSSDPPKYYYRTIRDLQSSAGPVFSAWERLDLQIPVYKVAPIVFLGRLYVFWLETTTRQLTEFKEGSSEFTGYRHSVRTKYAQLRLDGKWTPPQVMKVPGADPKVSGTDPTAVANVRLIDDPVHYLIIKLKDGTTHYLDGADADAQLVKWNGLGLVSFRSIPYTVAWDVHNRHHYPPLEEYTPEGWQWDRLYPSVLGASGENGIGYGFGAKSLTEALPESIDLLARTAAEYHPLPQQGGVMTPSVLVNTTADGSLQLFSDFGQSDDRGLPFFAATATIHDETIFADQGLISATGPLIAAPAASELQVLNGNEGSIIIESSDEPLLFQSVAGGYLLRRLGTTIGPQLDRAISTLQGIETLLKLSTQMDLAESPAPLVLLDSSLVASRIRPDPLAKESPVLTYLREIFLHIPFLVADYLNSRQQFADAQRWYHHVYDPTASEPGADEKTRPWRYREFRDVSIQNMREALTDPFALHAYRSQPFNPDAIARLRPGAYQKAIFMKYIDNLLDWGDSLFSQFTMESVNEATMLYVMAADILGPHPTQLGPCGETSGTANTYADIAPLLRPADPSNEPTTDFLIEELETFTIHAVSAEKKRRFIVDQEAVMRSTSRAMTIDNAVGVRVDGAGSAPPGRPTAPTGWNSTGAQMWKERAGTPLGELYSGGPIGGRVVTALGGEAAPRALSGDLSPSPPASLDDGFQAPQDGKGGWFDAPSGFERAGYLQSPGYSLGEPQPADPRLKEMQSQGTPAELVRARLVFCIPENKELRGYWDRVEDRLNKIRNCMDIAGVRRQLDLFAPEIDPHMLVRMRAAGLSLDDVMNVTSGNLPPYRFAYLIEKAKQHAALVQGFGAKLESALQQRDGEELTRLRAVHEQNLLKLRSQTVQWEIDAAEDTLESLNRQQTATEYRRDHFRALSQDGLSGWERTQQVTTHAAGGSLEVASVFQLLAGGLRILPRLGAPTAMTYGGPDMGPAALYGAGVLKLAADLAELAGKSAGLEASFQRRDEEWKYQVELANNDLLQIQKQIAAADLRRDIAIESQKVHERSIEQTEEVFDFLRDRFTNLGLFTWLTAELQKLHRIAFNAALSMARLAEQACQFEHPDETVKPSLTGDYWDAGHSGLLAGDRLLLDLHNLERSYIETNYRTLEIEQSYSLARFDPEALSKLKTECDTSFEIPEWYFDLTYPHYRRRIKAVRLTIPCVVGPHTNVGATLRLNDSHIRMEPRLDSRVAVPLRHTTAIAASMGQSDAGVFEFNFRDERYMPFEGAGVDSSWQLSLPSVVKPFDYSTISDVILRISYTAEEDSGLKHDVNDATSGILSTLTKEGVTRILSLRIDFPAAWNALLEGAAQATIDIGEVHVPFFMSGFDLAPATFDVLVEKLEAKDAIYPAVTFDSVAATVPAKAAEQGSGLYLLGQTQPVQFVGKHVLKVSDWGSVGKAGAAAGSPKRLDDSKIKDVVLRFVMKTKAVGP